MGISELRGRTADLTKLKTDKQRRFALELIKDTGKPMAAAIRAGVPKRSAASYAQRLLKNPIIKAFVEKAETDMVAKLDAEGRIRLEEVIEQLWNALTWRAEDLVDKDGRALLPHQLPKKVQCQVDGMKQKILQRYTLEDGTEEEILEIEYKMTPRVPARDQAFRILGAYASEKHEVNMQTKPVIPWDDLRKATLEEDRIEQRLLEIERSGGDDGPGGDGQGRG